MIFVVALLILSLVFYQEVIFGFCLLFLEAKRDSPAPCDLRLLAETSFRPRFYLCRSRAVDSMSLRLIVGPVVLVSEELWSSLSDDEKEALLFWQTLAACGEESWKRLLGLDDLKPMDRNALLYNVTPMTLTSLLQKTIEFVGPLGAHSIFGGLSILGANRAQTEFQQAERLKNLGEQWMTLKGE